jgi:ribosomal protein L11 methyltransferase
MTYTIFRFQFSSSEEFLSDVLSALLGEVGFESFVRVSNGLEAYIQSKNLKIAKIERLISDFEYDKKLTYTKEEIEDKNWNEEWEKHYFEPIVIDDKCVIHSSFHKDIPDLEYEIIIDPKMSFGTGHHETTALMVSEILRMDLEGKAVLDMGCGTSVLAILAAKRGAKKITAIDIDDWCVDNSLENIALNNVRNIDVLLGDAKLLRGKKFDIIIANINRNILLNDMGIYAKSLSKSGELYMSGFYSEDMSSLENEGAKHGLSVVYTKVKNNWSMMKMKLNG